MHPISEERTIREFVLPALGASGWRSVAWIREFPITAGRRTVANGRIRKGERLFADIALIHHPVGTTAGGHPISVVEVKRTVRDERTGVQQVKEYGRRLDLPLVYATNGRKIIEIDLAGGSQQEVDRFRTPEELWQNYRNIRELDAAGVRLFEIPYSRDVLAGLNVKEPRYYQHVAIQRMLQAIASGQQRLLTVLATGTGKSFASAQLVHSLWAANWPRGPQAPDPRPRVLYLADRDVLVNDPMVREFRPIFGEEDAVRVLGGTQTQARINFASYQALDYSELFSKYEPTWFDLVIVDECHRGSASANSQWSEILDHFSRAVHLGLTATPRVDAEADTFAYFGEPVYQYSLKQGIEDGFLAPFEVIRVLLSTDLDGVTIAQGTVDEDGVEVPARTYLPNQLERKLVIPERTEEAAGWVSRHLAASNRMNKTIVFCVHQEHAARFAEAIGNLNSDLMVQFDSEWAVRITSDEKEPGRVLLGKFQSPFELVPVVVSSSDMLTTGVDVPTVRNIVFFTSVNSMTRFKQMVGRGTRLAEEQGKDFFTIIDFTGVTGLFADSTFDGLPIRNTTTSADDQVPIVEPVEIVEVLGGDDVLAVAEPEADFELEPGGDLPQSDPPNPGDGAIVDDVGLEDEIGRRGRKYVVRGIEVTVLGEYLYVVEPDEDFRLRAIRIESWARKQILDLGYDAGSLRRQWADAVSRRALVAALGANMPFTLDELAVRLNFGDADPLDVLLRLAFDAPLRSRSDRLAQFTRTQQKFLGSFGPEARRILEMILEKYAEHGPEDLDPQVLSLPPLSAEGSVMELASRFGGPRELHAALGELNRRLYEAS